MLAGVWSLRYIWRDTSRQNSDVSSGHASVACMFPGFPGGKTKQSLQHSLCFSRGIGVPEGERSSAIVCSHLPNRHVGGNPLHGEAIRQEAVPLDLGRMTPYRRQPSEAARCPPKAKANVQTTAACKDGAVCVGGETWTRSKATNCTREVRTIHDNSLGLSR